MTDCLRLKGPEDPMRLILLSLLSLFTQYVPVTPWLKGKVSFLDHAVVQLATPDAILVVHLPGRPLLEAVPVLQNDNVVKRAAPSTKI